MRWRWLLLGSLLMCPMGQLACSASNGDAIPGEVRDAEPLDATTGPDPIERDSSSPTDKDGGTNPPKDGGPKDASSDGAVDGGPTSAAVRINEVYVERSGAGAKAEWVEIRGPAGVAIDDLSIRVIDDTGNPTSSTPYAVADTGQKMPASGVWVIGGFSANVNTIINIPQGWDLDTAGAIQLLRGGTLIDVVGWTTDPDGGTVPQPGTNPKSTGEGKPFVLPATGDKSFGRAAGGADTDDNKTDFCTMTQSAKAANGACQ